MTTIPSRLARITRTSSSPTEARSLAIQLYRDWYRSAPEIVSLYALTISPTLIRQRIREEFERNRYVTDVRVVDRLILKWRQEYQETMNCWKQEPHIMGMLLQPKERPKEAFLQKFFQGREDEGVIPAVSSSSSGF
ncbi:NdufA6 NADH-ubiquinone oxidoreductase 14.8 kDa subunit [Gautieria morchelliformis]|nr:NdufA6 NADH-ubiquinone oxidoreductase 14.8 kDa subunit [Gautieria morchelliformis]